MKPLVCAMCMSCCLVTSLAWGQVEPREDSELIEAPTPAPAPSRPYRVFVARLSLLGAHRELYDLSLNALGVEGSLGGEGRHHGGHANFHLTRGQTTGGLDFTEFGLSGTYEPHFSGFRCGVGYGISHLTIIRATNSEAISSTGLDMLLRAGYDFAEPSGPYVLGQLSLQLYNGGRNSSGSPSSWGPTLYAGWRF